MERLTIHSIYRGSDRSEDELSCKSSLAPKDENESDLESEYEQTLDDLIKAKKCNIFLIINVKL